MQRRTIYGIILLFFLISGLLVYGIFCRKCEGPGSLVKADVFVSSTSLAASFDRSEAVSDSLYLYKVLSVKGSIEKILKRESGNYVVTLSGQAPGRAVIDCNLDTIYNQRYLPLKTGDSVTIRGTCAGRLLNIVLTQCIIEK